MALREYLVGGLVQVKGWPAVVPPVDEGLDGGNEVLDRGEDAAADALRVMIEKKTSTRFGHDPDTSVKCQVIPVLASQARTSGWLCVP